MATPLSVGRHDLIRILIALDAGVAETPLRWAKQRGKSIALLNPTQIWSIGVWTREKGDEAMSDFSNKIGVVQDPR